MPASSAGFADLPGDFRVIRRVHDHGDAFVVLRGAAQHGRAADVDVLNRFGQRDAGFGDGLLEGIKIHDDEIDRLDLVRPGGGFVLADCRGCRAGRRGFWDAAS